MDIREVFATSNKRVYHTGVFAEAYLLVIWRSVAQSSPAPVHLSQIISSLTPCIPTL